MLSDRRLHAAQRVAQQDLIGVPPHSALSNRTPTEFRAHPIAAAASCGNGNDPCQRH